MIKKLIFLKVTNKYHLNDQGNENKSTKFYVLMQTKKIIQSKWHILEDVDYYLVKKKFSQALNIALKNDVRRMKWHNHVLLYEVIEKLACKYSLSFSIK